MEFLLIGVEKSLNNLLKNSEIVVGRRLVWDRMSDLNNISPPNAAAPGNLLPLASLCYFVALPDILLRKVMESNGMTKAPVSVLFSTEAQKAMNYSYILIQRSKKVLEK